MSKFLVFFGSDSLSKDVFGMNLINEEMEYGIASRIKKFEVMQKKED